MSLSFPSKDNSSFIADSKTIFLSRFSKLTCFFTVFLIFAGGMVTSTGSGLAVPDWPLSYGMLFPPMVGGIFYEHGHRMVAAFVGFLTLILTISIFLVEHRKWVKFLAAGLLMTVILQGLLGGLTVKFFLPKPVSIAHGILAQTFFVLSVILAYALSKERGNRRTGDRQEIPRYFLFAVLIFWGLIDSQLILGALMRHTGSGLAVGDFPTMGGKFIPSFDESMLKKINAFRFEHNLDPVNLNQIVVHFLHRAMALSIGLALIVLNILGKCCAKSYSLIRQTLSWLNLLVAVQIGLGIMTIYSLKSPIVTSLHVVTGAVTLGAAVLLILRTLPLGSNELKKYLTYA